MKFAVTYVMVTHLTRRRAGRSQTVVVDTNDRKFSGVNDYDKAYQPQQVERVFQRSYSTEHSEAKVIDVREIIELTSTERVQLQGVARIMSKLETKDELWRYRVSIRMMSQGLQPELQEKWKAIPATERARILAEVQ